MATALITGGTSGIGASFAKALAARGDDLVLVARDTDRLRKTAAELEGRYAVTVELLAADLASRVDALRVAERLTSDADPVDILVNNAGFGVGAKLTAADTAPIEHAMDVMIRAVLILGAAAGRTMAARGSGAIINVSSTASFVTMGGYSAIKAWVTTYSEGLAAELADTGVSVTALCPGWVRTEFHERAKIKTSTIPSWLWLDSDELVAAALRDVADRKVISIPSKRYKALMFVARHAPRATVRSASRRLSSGRH